MYLVLGVSGVLTRSALPERDLRERAGPLTIFFSVPQTSQSYLHLTSSTGFLYDTPKSFHL
jgi:hypothetical protein